MVVQTDTKFNPNKAGLFEGSFFSGAQFDPLPSLSYFKKN